MQKKKQLLAVVMMFFTLLITLSPVSASLALTMTLSYDASPQYLVNALAVYDGKLYAGTGLYAGQGNIYVYDGAAWTLSYTVGENQVWALAEYDGKLYAGTGAKYVGPGTVAGGVIYVYDGTTWSIAYDTPEDHVLGFGVYNGKLYAATSGLGNIYVYDGTSWSLAHHIVDQPHVRCFAEYGGKLYVGTEYTAAIYVYDGTSWSTAWNSASVYGVDSLAVYDGKLYAATSGKGELYVFDGTSWSVVLDSDQYSVWSLTVYGGRLFAGTWGGSEGLIYVFDGTEWELACAVDLFVSSLAGYGGRLYAGTSGKIYVSQILPIPVYVDIKPGSWPNPINIGDKGVFAVAICGTCDFDVKAIDPTTVKLYIDGIGVAPIRWSYADVATPYTGDADGGHALGGDGYLDLVFHFDTQTVVASDLARHVGENTPLIIKGHLHTDAPIMGQDYVWVLAPKRK